MKALSWVTDPHLDLVIENSIDILCREANEEDTDALVITGDIADGPNTMRVLSRLDKRLKKPLYFLLGNHDFYERGIHEQRHAVKMFAGGSQRSKYLPTSNIIELNANVCMLGFEGWADGGYGFFLGSQIKIVDYRSIVDLRALYSGRYDHVMELKIKELGEEDAKYAKPTVTRAVAKYNHVLFFTHVPPFEEACFSKDGGISDHHWLPHFGCKAMGDMLKRVMRNNPTKQMTVYCGHMHSGGTAQILDNLTAITGSAVYGNPKLLPRIEIPHGRSEREQGNTGANDQPPRDQEQGSGSRE